MSNIYDQHKAAFANVSAYVVLDGANERVATVAFKYPRDGAGRLYCYLHVFGMRMVRGYASGCGYDKHSASAHVAVCKLTDALASEAPQYRPGLRDTIDAFRAALTDSGYSWAKELENHGFRVLQAV